MKRKQHLRNQFEVINKLSKQYKEGRATELKTIGNAIVTLADIESDFDCEAFIRPLVEKLIERLSNMVYNQFPDSIVYYGILDVRDDKNSD
ncbi:MAG: hypothetical protein A2Y62_10440 [Candidatus Fischerbacteria bacterium RBG_13_37_8]|uniref:Uncharacterized protein n=1 Tax=Candidatus Fischerbacteria bacterium RBG_13_37_8 TaxID=1817863 RepID=A0A1F5V7M6_9BACT|nr:MAG: hypothetical protein A2Y62_10440 [Candidatus Fischerbacteria bacterium RBG_13_37_8]